MTQQNYDPQEPETAALRKLADDITLWRDTESAGYSEAIELICAAEKLLREAADALTRYAAKPEIETATIRLQRPVQGQLVDCTPEEFRSWCGQLFESVSHLNDAHSWFITILARTAENLLDALTRVQQARATEQKDALTRQSSPCPMCGTGSPR